MKLDNISAVVGCLVGVGIIISYIAQGEIRYAKAEDLLGTQTRIELKWLEDDYVAIRNRKWAVEDKYKEPRSTTQKQEIEALEYELKLIDEKKVELKK